MAKMKPTTTRFQPYHAPQSQRRRETYNGGKRPKTHRGEQDDPVIPPQLLALEMAAQEAQGDGRQRQYRHGDDDLHGPWLEVVRVVARQAGELGLRGRRHLGSRRATIDGGSGSKHRELRSQLAGSGVSSTGSRKGKKWMCTIFSQGGQSLFTTSYPGPQVPTKAVHSGQMGSQMPIIIVGSAVRRQGWNWDRTGIELGLKGVRCNSGQLSLTV